MSTELTPEVTWAQRSSSVDEERNYVYLTLMVPDVPKKDMKLDIQPTQVSFNGHSSSKKATYKVDLELFAEIDPNETKIHHTDRAIELVLRKKELKEEYWPRLLKENKKMHFLKTDFDKWVDEDEQDEAPDDEAINQMAGMGGMGGMGGGLGGDGGFGGIDFSKLGGAGGMPDMSALQGMAGAGGAGNDDDDDDDDDADDMPELEEEEEGAAAGDASKPKIEEIS